MATALALRTPNGREYPVMGTLRLGRAPESDVLVPDDLVSRQHARVWPAGDQLLAQDDGSSNGTYINGQRLPAGQASQLKLGDTLRVGQTTFTVVASTALATARAPAVPPAAPAAATRIDPAAALPAGPSAPAAVSPAAPNRSRGLLLGGCIGLLLLAVCGGLALTGALAGRPAMATALAQLGGPAVRPVATPSPGPGVGTANAATPGGGVTVAGPVPMTVLSTSTPATTVSPAEFAITAHNLADDLAALNQAQLKFIGDASSKSPALDDDLKAVAAAAFKVGLEGEKLGGAAAGQDGASAAAGQMASIYSGCAAYGYAQALDAQNLRAALLAGQLNPAAAVALVADYGARAWNPTVTQGGGDGNPFIPFLGASNTVPTPAPVTAAGQDSISKALGGATAPVVWFAAAPGVLTRTVTLPVGAPLADPRDAALLAALITPAGQADAASAQQAAAAGLLRMGARQQAPASGGHAAGLLAALWAPPQDQTKQSLTIESASAITGVNDVKQGSYKAFPKGKVAATIIPPTPKDSPNIVTALFGLDSGNDPDSDEEHSGIRSLEFT